MRKLTFFGVFLLLLLALAGGLWAIGKSRTFQFFGKITPRVETQEKLVALTFDDGPTPRFTDEILETLKQQDVKATFFLIGGELEKNPEEGRKIVAAGHEIGNHSFSHQRMLFVSSAFVKDEIEKTDALIRAAGYERQPLFRPPYGKKLFALPYYLSQNNRQTIMCDVEPESYPQIAKSAEAITKHVLDNTRSGSIILLHVMYDPQKKSLMSVKPIIEGLKQRGFRLVTVSELLDSQQ
jgi:peptidoglycan-N-acetylglucosamine deacetylase